MPTPLLRANAYWGMMVFGGMVWAHAGERELLSAGEMRALIDESFVCGREGTIVVDSRNAAVFGGGREELQRFVAAARSVLLFECSRLQTMAIIGRSTGQTQFLGRTTASDRWVLRSEFDLQSERAAVESTGLNEAGILLLAARFTALEKKVSPIPESLWGAARQRVASNLSLLTESWRASIASLPADARGIEEFNRRASAWKAALLTFAPGEAASLASVEQAQREQLHTRVVRDASEQLAQQRATGWRRARDLRGHVPALCDALRKAGDATRASQLEKEVEARFQALAAGKWSADLKQETDSATPDWPGLTQLNTIAVELEELAQAESTLAALQPVLDEAVLRVTEEFGMNLLAEIGKSGRHHSEIPLLIEQADEEAVQFEDAGLEGLAEAVRAAAIARAETLAKESHPEFVKELAALETTRAGGDELTLRAANYDEMGKLVEGLKAYAVSIRERVATMKAALVTEAYKRTGLPDS
ncbi:MAG: hypothetical protein ACREH8_04110, partial [Opitutaceae bacterium]